MNNILFIGLNGFAGAGKDTVAKMLKTILSKNWESIEEAKEYYFSTYTNPTQSATYKTYNSEEKPSVMCIAYADQLKEICARIFGIPRQRFYQNKSTAWICINDKFQYTEIQPEEDHIITSDEYYYSLSEYRNNNTKYWMSLREILVYVGTYVLQQSINKSIFVNIVRNIVKEEQYRNDNLKYVIVTDNRFSHELDYIRENNGITMSIVRDSIQQLDNIAEHDLDDVEDYDYIIDNSNTYNNLFETVWNIVHNDLEFKNQGYNLYTRDNINNYLRLVKQISRDNETYNIYKLCIPFNVQQVYKQNNEISAINLTGGPLICLNEPIDIVEETEEDIIPVKIVFNEESKQYLIYTKV